MTTSAPPAARPKSTDYSMGYTSAFLELLQRRTAAHNASHLIPHLRTHMDILDLGSGPGNITEELADMVPMGTATGIDCNPHQIESARQRAFKNDIPNVHYVQADATNLPFPDDHFDVVHAHAFLMHAPRVKDVLAEARRVLKPGGIISSRDMDVQASYISPSSPSEPTIFDMLARLIRQTGGTPTIARHLKVFFTNAGFTPIEAGASSDFFDSRRDVAFLSRLLSDWALSPETERDAVHRNIATPADFVAWRSQLARWSTRTSAVGCFYFGHVVALKLH